MVEKYPEETHESKQEHICSNIFNFAKKQKAAER
jgi:hypothetical protein